MTKEMLHLLCMVWAKEAVITGDKLTLKGLEHKVLVSTSRPKRLQAFMGINRFLSLWAEHEPSFEKEPPEIAINYTSMPTDTAGIAEAISMELTHPLRNETDWTFQLKFREQKMQPDTYNDIALVIDWIPTPYCPEPIAILFPELANL